MEPIVHKLKRILRDRQISHGEIAERINKHRTFITRKLNGDSMETRLLEQIMEATELTYQDLVCTPQADASVRAELDDLRREIMLIKEALPKYQTRQDS